MPRLAYVNGRYLPHGGARVHVEDRGYQFADAVYEVIALRGGRQVEPERHFGRLDRSLRELRIDWPVPRHVMRFVAETLVRRNGVRDGYVYIQVSRGVAPRDHAFPAAARPSLVMTTRRTRPFDAGVAGRGVGIVLRPDIRWKRRDLKTVGLLPNVMAKQDALDAGAFDAWLVDDAGTITEGTASNAWIVTGPGVLVTRTADADILNGVTRLGVLDLVREAGLRFEERPFTVDEAKRAREAFLTSSTNWIRPVVAIDGDPVGDGEPGPLVRRLVAAYAESFGAV